MPDNPYFAKGPLRDPAMFYGRKDLLQHIYDAIFHRHSVSIVGPRSIGKSSLLWHASRPEVQAQFPFDLSHHIFVFLDLRKYLSKSGEDFFQNVSMLITAQGARLGLGPTLYDGAKAEDEFSSILDQIGRRGYFPVLLLDAFDKVTLNKQFDASIFEFLRLHATMHLVSYITATIAPLSTVCHPDIAGAAFFKIFKPNVYTLEALTGDESIKLITVPSQQAGISFEEDDIALVLRLAGRHPYFIQRVCYLLYQWKLKQSKMDVKELEAEVYKELSSLFEEIWNQLSKEQQLQLQFRAQQKGNQYCELPELSESWLFRQFVRNICRSQFLQITKSESELEKIMDKIGDPAKLGETRLRLMKVVSQCLKQDTLPSYSEIGMAIRETLGEALKRLQGTDIQTDLAPDWAHYNILYYGYFNHHFKKEHIAKLLGISIQLYSRERKKALKELRNALVEMEDASTSDED